MAVPSPDRVIVGQITQKQQHICRINSYFPDTNRSRNIGTIVT
jgi:hypothetical protein